MKTNCKCLIQNGEGCNFCNPTVVWGVVDSNNELIIDQTSFYQNKDYAVSAVKLMNESVVEKKKPYKVKKAYLVIAMNEEWQKEFDKIAPATLEIEGYSCDLRPVIKPIKSSIRNLLASQKQEILDIVLEDVPHRYQERLIKILTP